MDPWDFSNIIRPPKSDDECKDCVPDNYWFGMEIYYPEFEHDAQRLSSFKDPKLPHRFPFPDETKEKENKKFVEQLVNACFFYLGIKDWVVCYHCSLGFKNVNEDEPPLIMHKRYFPDCPALKKFGYIDTQEYNSIEGFHRLKTKRITIEEKEDVQNNTEIYDKLDEARKRFFEERQCQLKNQ